MIIFNLRKYIPSFGLVLMKVRSGTVGLDCSTSIIVLCSSCLGLLSSKSEQVVKIF